MSFKDWAKAQEQKRRPDTELPNDDKTAPPASPTSLPEAKPAPDKPTSKADRP